MAQHPTTSVTKAVVNLNNTLLDDATLSALAKRLSFAISPSVLLIEDVIGGVEKAMSMLPIEAAEEVWQETKNPHTGQETEEQHKQDWEAGCPHTHYGVMLISLSCHR